MTRNLNDFELISLVVDTERTKMEAMCGSYKTWGVLNCF